MILSRTFHRPDSDTVFEHEIEALRRAESELASRSAQQVQADAQRIHARIREIAAQIKPA